MTLKDQKGFTLIEVIVVAGIIAILAGILVPIIFKEIDESKITRASADIRSLSTALIVLRKDTGQWPISASCMSTVTLLGGAGAMPTIPNGLGWNSNEIAEFDKFLNTDDNNCWPDTWKGPYIAAVNADPWGRKYITNADSFPMLGQAPVWIVSAGPDGTVNTATTDASPSGDDIGMRLR